jgi:hypothetical protein
MRKGRDMHGIQLSAKAKLFLVDTTLLVAAFSVGGLAGAAQSGHPSPTVQTSTTQNSDTCNTSASFPSVQSMANNRAIMPIRSICQVLGAAASSS